jgi:hypothetical protein
VQGCAAIFRRKMRGLFANRLPRIVRMTILGQEIVSRCGLFLGEEM